MISKRTLQNELNRPIPVLKEVSSNELQHKIEKALKDVSKMEAKEEEKGKHGKNVKRWRFQYSSPDIEECISSIQDPQENKTLKELCKYILKNSKKNELVICLLQPKNSLWFKQFDFIEQDSVKQVAEGKFLNAQSAVRDMGSDYSILYSAEESQKKNSKNKLESSSQESKPLLTQDSNLTKVREDFKDNDEDAEEGESEDEAMTEIQKSKSIEISSQKNLESKRSRRKLISHWSARIFRGETISQIREELGKGDDHKLIWAFIQSLDLLKKVQNDPDLFNDNHTEILRKRQYEDDKEEEEGEKPKKSFIKEGKKVVDLEGDSQKKVSKKKKEKKEKEVKLNPTEHDLIADSISFYKSPAHFKKSIVSLPLFQKELEAFEATLIQEEVQIIEDAIETGFNPIHYIYQYKIGAKSLAKIKTGIYKKCLNTPSLELIYRYIIEHLRKKNTEEASSEDDKENILP